MNKIRIGVIVLALLLFTKITSLAQNSSTNILINGVLVEFTSTSGYPFVDENSRTQVPFRITLEAFGAKVNWEQSDRTAIAEMGGIRVEVPIGEKYIIVNGQRIENDTAALIVEGKTYLPIRKVMEAFGATVNWKPQNNEVEITTIKDKNIYTEEYLEKLVASTESELRVKDFRNENNPRRRDHLKVEGKYFDMYYPNDEYGKKVASFLANHMDRTYMMLADIYGLQATVEVHIIHEKDALSLREGEIRKNERVTFVWLEPNNDDGGNNLSEFVHEVNHNFFDEANGGSTNVMWINESNAKLITSLYIKNNYVGYTEMWSFYEIDNMARGLSQPFEGKDVTMTLDRANEILKVEKAWSNADGEKRLAQRYSIYFCSYLYNTFELEEYKYFLRNLGTGDVVRKMEELLDMSSQEITRTILEDINLRSSTY